MKRMINKYFHEGEMNITVGVVLIVILSIVGLTVLSKVDVQLTILKGAVMDRHASFSNSVGMYEFLANCTKIQEPILRTEDGIMFVDMKCQLLTFPYGVPWSKALTVLTLMFLMITGVFIGGMFLVVLAATGIAIYRRKTVSGRPGRVNF